MITIVVADDQAMIREAFATLLDLEPDLDVVGRASTSGQAVDLAGTERPDVLIMDVQMPSGTTEHGQTGYRDGIEATAEVLRRSPSTKVIIVTTFGRPGYLQRALTAGAVGFMVKDAPTGRLVDGIRRVAQGLRVVDPELAVSSLSIGSSPLTPRERDVLAAAAQGGGSVEVAKRVHLSEGTVRNYLSAAIGKLGAANRAEAIRTATENGWLD